MLTNGLDTEQIIDLAASRPESPWHWGKRLNKDETDDFAIGLRVKLDWYSPIRPGDLYLAKRNGTYKLLTCRQLGEACIHPVEPAYSYDFNECVKVLGVDTAL